MSSTSFEDISGWEDVLTAPHGHVQPLPVTHKNSVFTRLIQDMGCTEHILVLGSPCSRTLYIYWAVSHICSFIFQEFFISLQVYVLKCFTESSVWIIYNFMTQSIFLHSPCEDWVTYCTIECPVPRPQKSEYSCNPHFNAVSTLSSFLNLWPPKFCFNNTNRWCST